MKRGAGVGHSGIAGGSGRTAGLLTHRVTGGIHRLPRETLLHASPFLFGAEWANE